MTKTLKALYNFLHHLIEINTNFGDRKEIDVLS